MQRYDTYKDSGMKWLGEIPSHWESIPLKKCFISSESGLWGDDPKQNDDDAICIRVADFDYSKFSIKTEHLTLRSYGNLLSENKKLTKGDLLLEKSGGGELFPVGRVVRLNLDLGKTTCSNFIQKLSPSQNYCSSFLCYLFSSMYTKKVNGLFYNQTTGIQNLKIKEYLNQTVFLPPLAEQTAIANYLDTATAKIDAAIAQQQKMIDLLNERKQIIINRAVTKGLNPNAKMKDSGVEWIGEVPEHWEVRRVKSITSKVGSGVTPRGGGETYVDKGVMFLRSQNIYFEGFKLDDVAFITDAVDASMSNTRVKVGDVLFNITGGSIGRCYYVPEGFPKANVNQHVSIVRPYNFSTEYLYYLLRSHMSQIQVDLQQTGGNREGLTAFALKNFVFPIPPKTEQKMIIHYLNDVDMKLEQTIQNCQNQISLLQERKQIIINEVVTGKVKVVNY